MKQPIQDARIGDCRVPSDAPLPFESEPNQFFVVWTETSAESALIKPFVTGDEALDFIKRLSAEGVSMDAIHVFFGKRILKTLRTEVQLDLTDQVKIESMER